MTSSRYRWLVVAVFFVFMLLHQSDRLLIGPLTTPIMEEFGITRTQMGAVTTGALLIAAIMFPLWGYLYDRYARAKLLALASFLWGATTWLNAVVRVYPAFLVTRAATGIDDSSYPGLYSLISDYFGPKMRGKIYGLLQLTQPLGYLIGTILALALGGAIGWRNVFFLTGALGLVVAVAIFFSVREPQRGKSEPELENLDRIGIYRFDWKIALQLVRKRSLWPLFVQGFVGVFPWQVITFWFFNYLQTERGYSDDAVFATMVPAVLVLAAGYFVGGWLGDVLFKRTPRGRLIVCTVGVLTGAVLLYLTLNVPAGNQGLFLVMLVLTALFIPFASPNVVATIYDITLPEVRSTVMAMESFLESIGAALAPLMAGAIADQSTLGNAILLICTSAWLIGTVFLVIATYLIPRDIAVLRRQLRERADMEQRMAIG
ncbi:MAG TPA: MFS transporter [Anaerolineae bacterium]|nr:MFS transporter [Anaerolineae bacterium]